MAAMVTLTTAVALAVITSLLTSHYEGLHRMANASVYDALASVWREGYLAGVEDEVKASGIDVSHDGYRRTGANRANP